MAHPIQSISETLTAGASGDFGAFDVRDYDSISVLGTIPSGGLNLSFQVQLLDGTWIVPFTGSGPFFTGGPGLIPTQTFSTPYSSCRIEYSVGGSDTTISFSVWGTKTS